MNSGWQHNQFGVHYCRPTPYPKIEVQIRHGNLLKRLQAKLSINQVFGPDFFSFSLLAYVMEIFRLLPYKG